MLVAKVFGGSSLPACVPGMPGQIDTHLCAAAQASSRAFTWRGPSRPTRRAWCFLRLLRRGARSGEGERSSVSQKLSVMRLRLWLCCVDIRSLSHWRALFPSIVPIQCLCPVSDHPCESGAARARSFSQSLCVLRSPISHADLNGNNLEGMRAVARQECR